MQSNKFNKKLIFIVSRKTIKVHIPALSVHSSNSCACMHSWVEPENFPQSKKYANDWIRHLTCLVDDCCILVCTHQFEGWFLEALDF